MPTDTRTPEVYALTAPMGFYVDGECLRLDHSDTTYTMVTLASGAGIPAMPFEGPVDVGFYDDSEDWVNGPENDEQRIYPTLYDAVVALYGPIEGDELPAFLRLERPGTVGAMLVRDGVCPDCLDSDDRCQNPIHPI